MSVLWSLAILTGEDRFGWQEATDAGGVSDGSRCVAAFWRPPERQPTDIPPRQGWQREYPQSTSWRIRPTNATLFIALNQLTGSPLRRLQRRVVGTRRHSGGRFATHRLPSATPPASKSNRQSVCATDRSVCATALSEGAQTEVSVLQAAPQFGILTIRLCRSHQAGVIRND